MVALIINVIIVLVVCGFLYWAYLKIIPLIPIAEPFKAWISVLLLILIGAIIIFWAVIPLLRAIPSLLRL